MLKAGICKIFLAAVMLIFTMWNAEETSQKKGLILIVLKVLYVFKLLVSKMDENVVKVQPWKECVCLNVLTIKEFKVMNVHFHG